MSERILVFGDSASARWAESSCRSSSSSAARRRVLASGPLDDEAPRAPTAACSSDEAASAGVVVFEDALSAVATASMASARPVASVCSFRCSAFASNTTAACLASAALIVAWRWPSDSRMAARFLRSAASWSSIDRTISRDGWMSRTSTRVTTIPHCLVTAFASRSRIAFSCSRAEKVASSGRRPISARSCVSTRFWRPTAKSSMA
mmetsp:Transcript_22602/g.89735  ORF Transcript_22602/g.89735 Transcript_22602/m.89735 type:complete len:206 (+) Transcript_22602:477-1094(+)